MPLETIEFRAWGKTPRLYRDMIVTEKIDGTNAAIIVTDSGEVGAQSRNRLLTPESDNFGFAAWVEERKEKLVELGPGHHFGEWYGAGINRNYALPDRRFALFNVNHELPLIYGLERVPVLARGVFDTDVIEGCLRRLRHVGSVAVPIFKKPEGVVVRHEAARQSFKILLENDNQSKGRFA